MSVGRPHRLPAGVGHQVDSAPHNPHTAGAVDTRVAGAAFARLAGHIRRRHLVVIDIAAIMIAACAGVAFRMDRMPAPMLFVGFPQALTALVIGQLASNVVFGLYDRQWRHASVPDLLQVVWAAVVGAIAGAGLFYGVAAILRAHWATSFPRSFWPIVLVLTAGALGGVRFAIRAADVPRVSGAARAARPRRTLLYGAGRIATMPARSAQRDPGAGVLPVGFLDDDPAQAGAIVGGPEAVFGRGPWAIRIQPDTGAHPELPAPVGWRSP